MLCPKYYVTRQAVKEGKKNFASKTICHPANNYQTLIYLTQVMIEPQVHTTKDQIDLFLIWFQTHPPTHLRYLTLTAACDTMI